MSRIEWRHDGRRIVLPVSILRPGAADLTSVPALALIDTGASNSGIVRRLADELDLPPTGKRPLYIASGLVQVERYLFRIGLTPDASPDRPRFPFVFEATLGFELADTTPLPDGRRLDAIFGMDVLRHCAFAIDAAGRCLLEFG